MPIYLKCGTIARAALHEKGLIHSPPIAIVPILFC